MVHVFSRPSPVTHVFQRHMFSPLAYVFPRHMFSRGTCVPTDSRGTCFFLRHTFFHGTYFPMAHVFPLHLLILMKPTLERTTVLQYRSWYLFSHVNVFPRHMCFLIFPWYRFFHGTCFSPGTYSPSAHVFSLHLLMLMKQTATCFLTAFSCNTCVRHMPSHGFRVSKNDAIIAIEFYTGLRHPPGALWRFISSALPPSRMVLTPCMSLSSARSCAMLGMDAGGRASRTPPKAPGGPPDGGRPLTTPDGPAPPPPAVAGP